MASTSNNPANASNVRIGVLEKVGFGLGDFASNLTFGFINLFLLFFFTNVYGLGAADTIPANLSKPLPKSALKGHM